MITYMPREKGIMKLVDVFHLKPDATCKILATHALCKSNKSEF